MTKTLASSQFCRCRRAAVSTSMLALIAVLGCGSDASPTAVASNPVVAVAISSPEVRLAIGDEAYLKAQAFDANGVARQVAYRWTSANSAIATISTTAGVLRAIAPGVTTVTVSTGAVSAIATVIVRLPDPAVSISILSSSNLIAGTTQNLRAAAFDSTGRPVADVPIEWRSLNPSVATVSTTRGEITAIAPGSATVVATSGTLTTTATMSVVKLAGSYAFARSTVASDGRVTSSQVISYSEADGTTRSFAGTGKFSKIDRPSWSPDGKLLSVEVVYDFFDYPAVESFDYSSDIFVIDPSAPSNAPWRALTTNGLSKSPRWSNDGSRIAYMEEPTLLSLSQIYTVDPSGGRRTRVTNTQTLCGRPSWSPDGKRLAFTDWSLGDIFLINADGTGLTNLTNRARWEVDPSWSPDGKHIAWASSSGSTPGSFRVDIYAMDVDGKNVRQLSSVPGYAATPEWSPDGSQIIFSAGDNSAGGALYVMNADGSSVGRLTTPPLGSRDVSPTWRP